MLYCAFVLTLGLQRLTFAFGGRGFGSWLALVITHAIESSLWWGLALHPEFNTKSLGWQELAAKAAHLDLPGGPQTSILLLFVPFLALLFIVLGPNRKGDISQIKKVK